VAALQVQVAQARTHLVAAGSHPLLYHQQQQAAWQVAAEQRDQSLTSTTQSSSGCYSAHRSDEMYCFGEQEEGSY
jgi:hypothetical protein